MQRRKSPARSRAAGFLLSHSVRLVPAWERGDLHEGAWCSDLGFFPHFAMCRRLFGADALHVLAPLPALAWGEFLQAKPNAEPLP